jgi:hypothetical protein
MAPRMSTISSEIKKAIEQIEDAMNNASKKPGCPRALKTLQRLDERMGNAKAKGTRPPNAYAKFVKEQFPIFQKKYGDSKSVTEIWALISKEWKRQKQA